ncbi:hypothetical protein BCR36DRAFT_351554 [Piromyces finnis]|uniref:Protein kinase domain-containing protein n=1 Tax=Piromyces finnis TaxID=1754191 RepID=A0A1Y1VAC0_9FUNG|nr:hypothetical protein BCR36DRAFT_351554 [Piromyces finnis]|eukprot:ORX51059.1 hypothetical protein BCR36DRAFT_351554 [Piromyces finnis]
MDIHKNSMINNQLYMEMQNKDNYGDDNNRSSLNNSFFQYSNTEVEVLSYGMIYSHQIKNIKQLKIIFKKSLSLIDELDDPLDVFNSYVQWLQLNYQSIENFSIEDDVIPIIFQALKLLNGDPRYINDIRYLKFWVIYSGFVDDPVSIFEFLEKNNLCLKLAAYYEEYSKLREIEKSYDEARKIYHLGIKRKARPFPRLKRNYEAFKRRIDFLNKNQESEFYRVKMNNANNESLNSCDAIKNFEFPYRSIDYLKNNYEYSQDEIPNDNKLQLSDLNIIEHDIESELKQEALEQNYDNYLPIIKNESVIVNSVELENTNELIPKKENNNRKRNIFKDKNIMKINSEKLSSDITCSQYKYLLNNQWNQLNCKVFEYKNNQISFEELRAIMKGYPLKMGKESASSSERISDEDMDIDHDDNNNNDKMFEEIFTNISASISNNSKENDPNKSSIFQNAPLHSKRNNKYNNNKSSYNNNLTFNIDPKYYETMDSEKYDKENLITPNKEQNLKHIEDTPTPIYINNNNDTLKSYSLQQELINENETIPIYHTIRDNNESLDSQDSLFPSVYKFDDDKLVSPSLNIKKNRNQVNKGNDKEDSDYDNDDEITDKDIINKLKSSISDLDKNVSHMKETIKRVDDHDKRVSKSEVNDILKNTVNSIFDSRENDEASVNQQMDNYYYYRNGNNISATPKNTLKVDEIQSPIKIKKDRIRRHSQMALSQRNRERINKKSDIMDEINKREFLEVDYNTHEYLDEDETREPSWNHDNVAPTYISHVKNESTTKSNKYKLDTSSRRSIKKHYMPSSSDLHVDLNQSMENLKLSSKQIYTGNNDDDTNENKEDDNGIINHFSSVKKSTQKPYMNTSSSTRVYYNQESNHDIYSNNLKNKRRSRVTSVSSFSSPFPTENNKIISHRNEIAIVDIRTANPYIDKKFNNITDDYFKNLIKNINNHIVNNKIIDYTKRPEFLNLKCIIEDYTKASGNTVRNPSPTLLEDEIKKGISYVFYENNSCKVIKEIGRGEFSKIYLVGLNSLDDELSSSYNDSEYGFNNNAIDKKRLSLPSYTKRIKLALKIQHNAINSMEYYNIQKLHQRMQSYEGMDSSFVKVKQLYKYKNACHILMEYCEFGSLLEALNYQFRIHSDISSPAAMANTYDTLLKHSIKSLSSALSRSKANSHRRSKSKMVIENNSFSETKEKIYQCILSSSSEYDGFDETKKIHEVLVVFYTIEILKMVETLHQSNIIHSDIKIDNFMLRMPLVESYRKFFNDDKELCSPRYCAGGQEGWNNYGLSLIDFGQSIDLTDFSMTEGSLWFRQSISEIEMNAATPATSVNSISSRNYEKRTSTESSRIKTVNPDPNLNQGNHCWEIRHHQPYLYEIDWYGVAGVIHALLFNEYMEVEEEEDTSGDDAYHNTDKLSENERREFGRDEDANYTIYDFSGQEKKPIKKTTYSSSDLSSLSIRKRPHLRIKKTFKRYWQRELWQRLFDVLLNAKTINSSLSLENINLYTKPSSFSPISNTATTTTTHNNIYYEERFPSIQEIRTIRQSFETWLSQHDRSSQYNLMGYLRLLSAQCLAINKF